MQAHEPELTELLDALCEESLTRDSAARLELLARNDRQARVRYITYLYLNASLRWSNPTDSLALDDQLADSEASPPAHLASNRPLHGLLDNTILGKLGSFQGITLNGLLVAMLVGAGILIGALMFTSRPVNVASRSVVEPKYVGRITGMVDCQWFDPHTAVGYGRVALGSKYAVASGLLEITYQSGAKVVVQGPATFDVDSPNGGFLAIGKLTGVLEKKAGGNSSLIANPFVIRTSAATVTDLGTEFGLHVCHDGRNNVHVFDGKVKLTTSGIGPQRTGATEVVMEQDSAARLTPNGQVTTHAGPDAKQIAATFTRRLVHDDSNVVDLLDIVAGGDGTGWRRERGIDPVTGNDVSTFLSQWRPADARYQHVSKNPLIDGVFVPDGGGQSPVHLDSAGHTFSGFPKTAGGTMSTIWARAANVTLDNPEQQAWFWIYAMGSGTEYMSRNWGLLGLHANAGITFDLKAICAKHQGAGTARFRATAGAPRGGLVDLWVFVDGRLQFRRERLRKQDGPISVEVALTAANRFLTLASTDAGDGIDNDWLVLGDPVIELEGAKAAK